MPMNLRSAGDGATPEGQQTHPQPVQQQPQPPAQQPAQQPQAQQQQMAAAEAQPGAGQQLLAASVASLLQQLQQQSQLQQQQQSQLQQQIQQALTAVLASQQAAAALTSPTAATPTAAAGSAAPSAPVFTYAPPAAAAPFSGQPTPLLDSASRLLASLAASTQQVSPQSAALSSSGAHVGLRSGLIDSIGLPVPKFPRFAGHSPLDAAAGLDSSLSGTWSHEAGRAVRPGFSSTPRTRAEVAAWLWDWLDTSQATDVAQFRAINTHVRQAVGFLAEVADPSHVLDYFQSARDAAALGRYDPMRDGPVYVAGLVNHIIPFRKLSPAARAASNGAARTRRPAPTSAVSSSSSSSTGNVWCSLHRLNTHSDAECHQQQQHVAKKPKVAVKVEDAARARRPAPDDDD